MSTTKKGKAPTHQQRTRPSRKRLLTIAVILVTVIAIGSVVSFVFLQPAQVSFSLNAAIIDQLSMEFPDYAFVEKTTTILRTYGFNVSCYNQTLDVEFFRELAKLNFGIILLRAHSALRNDSSAVDLFTTEPFSTSTHVEDQNDDLVVKGTLNYTGTPRDYFAITSKFIENLEGTFPKSIVIAMGCWGLKEGLESTLPSAFLKKGATAYLGWTDMVDYSHTDVETEKLLGNLLVFNRTLDDAVDHVAPDTFSGSRMRYYPSHAGGLRMSDLMAEAKALTASMSQLIGLSRCRGFISSVVNCFLWSTRIGMGQAVPSSVSVVSKQPRLAGCGEHHP